MENMNVTNKHFLPEAIVSAISNDDYDPGKCDISVTTLIAPPQIRHLKRLHGATLTEDASDCIWRLMGQAVHSILERADSTDMREERLYGEFNGWVVSGKFDNVVVSSGHLSDYKVTSVYAVKSGIKPEWEAQLNCLAHLCRLNGRVIKELSITAILRDWNKYGAKTNFDYPAANWIVIPCPLWSENQAKQYIDWRVRLHQEADKGNVAPCTDEERWRVPDKWALMAKGKKRAIKLFNSQAEIEKVTLSDGQYIEPRPGEDKRCENYCQVSAHCKQFLETRAGAHGASPVIC